MSEHEEKFTPGPWCVYPVSVKSESCDIVKQDDTNDRIAVTCEQSINEGRELANAHLIAAAPELYEALQKADAALLAVGRLIIKLPESAFNRIGAEVNQALDAQEIVEAALAKARGAQ